MYSENPVMVRFGDNATVVSTSSIDSEIKALESLTKAIIAFIVIIVLLQLATLALLFRHLRKKRTTRKTDEEQGVELQVRAQPASVTPQVQSHEMRATRKADKEQGVEIQVRAQPLSGTPQVQSHANEQGQEHRVKRFSKAYWNHEDYLNATHGPQAPEAIHQMDRSNQQFRRRETEAHASGAPSRTVSRPQMYGRDYSSGGRESRFGGDVHQSYNSNSSANYGRRGNRFAHGT